MLSGAGRTIAAIRERIVRSEEKNQMIKKQNALLQKVIATFGKVSGALSIWKEWLNDIRRKQRSNSHEDRKSVV